MIDTITPVVHGGRRSPYLGSVVLHTVGATFAAAAFGFLMGSVGYFLTLSVEERGLVVFLAVIALVYFVREAFRVPVPIPDRHRQVPEWWRTFFSPSVTALLYGLGLGVGFFTYLSFGTFVAVTAGALAVGDPLEGALITAPFGLARGLSVVIASRTTSTDDVDRVLERLEGLSATPIPRLVNAVALGGILVAALVAVLQL